MILELVDVGVVDGPPAADEGTPLADLIVEFGEGLAGPIGHHDSTTPSAGFIKVPRTLPAPSLHTRSRA